MLIHACMCLHFSQRYFNVNVYVYVHAYNYMRECVWFACLSVCHLIHTELYQMSKRDPSHIHSCRCVRVRVRGNLSLVPLDRCLHCAQAPRPRSQEVSCLTSIPHARTQTKDACINITLSPLSCGGGGGSHSTWRFCACACASSASLAEGARPTSARAAAAA